MHVVGESLFGHGQVVGIEGNVGESEPARVVGQRRAGQSADRILNFNGGIGDHRAGLVNHRASDRGRISRLRIIMRINIEAERQIKNSQQSRSKRLPAWKHAWNSSGNSQVAE